MAFTYNAELFNENQNLIVTQAIKEKIPEDILEIMTKIDDASNEPVFSSDQLREIYFGFKSGLDVDDIKIYAATKKQEYEYDDKKYIAEESIFDYLQMSTIQYTLIQIKNNEIDKKNIELLIKLNANNEPVFNAPRMKAVADGIVYGLDIESIQLYTKLNNEKPIFDSMQMSEIYKGLIDSSLQREDVEFYARLNENDEPIFDSEQMLEIRWAFIHKFSKDKMDILTKMKDDKPLFHANAMEIISEHLTNADAKHIKLFKEFVEEHVNEKISLDALTSLMNNNIPVDCLRIYRDLHKLGYSNQQVFKIKCTGSINYKKLKEIKYLATCAEKLGYKEQFANVIYQCENNIKSFRDEFTYMVLKDKDYTSMDEANVLQKCLSYKLEPEVIKYMLDAGNSLNAKGMKVVAIGSLNGLNVKEIDKVRNSVSRSYDDFKEAVEEAIKIKYNDISDIDDRIDIKTDWFEGKNKER